MTAIILTIHTMIVLALVGVVLLQRSEGGAAGMLGGGGGGGGLMSGRGAANALTRSTTVWAGLFFTSSIVLALVANSGSEPESIVPISDETTLEEDDFSDILGAGDEGEEEAAPDAFELPDDLGIEDEEPPQER